MKKGSTALVSKSTAGDQAVVWDFLDPDPAYEVKIVLSSEDQKKYKIDGDKDTEPKSIGAGDDVKVVFKLIPYLRVHLKLAFKDPEDAERPLPKDLKVTLKFDDASVADVAVKLDDQGRILGPDNKLGAAVPRRAKGFCLDFAQAGTQYVKCEKRGDSPKKQELKAEADIDQEKTADYRAFRLPTGAGRRRTPTGRWTPRRPMTRRTASSRTWTSPPRRSGRKTAPSSWCWTRTGTTTVSCTTTALRRQRPRQEANHDPADPAEGRPQVGGRQPRRVRRHLQLDDRPRRQNAVPVPAVDHQPQGRRLGQAGLAG